MQRFSARHGLPESQYTPDLPAEEGRPSPTGHPFWDESGDDASVYQQAYFEPHAYGARLGRTANVVMHFIRPSHVRELIIFDDTLNAGVCVLESIALDSRPLTCSTTAGPTIPTSWFRDGKGRFQLHNPGSFLVMTLRTQRVGTVVFGLEASLSRGTHWGINCESGNPDGCPECEWVTKCREYECERSSAFASACAKNK